MEKQILITTAQKIFFNGMTVFGLDARYIEIGTIVLDAILMRVLILLTTSL